jgi:HCOMODA/2-hydroxy-3-carboxy-muconic semialdehyde decarboxylase
VLGNHPAALMRGHGAVVTGPSLPRVVGRTIFLALNATLQAQAMSMGAPITYMDDEEVRKIEAREGHGLARTWEGWKRKGWASLAQGGPCRNNVAYMGAAVT